MEKVIFDNDAGSDIDDLYALALILKHPNLELLGVTTVSGDTQARARLIGKMLRLGDHGHVPVRAGIRIPEDQLRRGVNPEEYRINLTHCQLVTSEDPEHGREYDDAVAFILKTLEETSEPITLIGTGPWSNLAEVVRQCTEKQRANIKCIALMGGEIHLNLCESNAKGDPEAVKIICDSGLPVFIAGWSPSRELNFPMPEIEELTRDHPSAFVQALRGGTDLWWGKGSRFKPGPVCYDVIPVFWAAGDRENISCIGLDRVEVELEGIHTRGMMVVHPWIRMAAPSVTQTSPDSLTFADRIQADAMKARFNALVFGKQVN